MRKSKIINIVMLAILAVGLTGCKKNGDEVVSYPKIYDYLNSITLNTFDQKLQRNESFIVYFARPSCSDCEMLDERIMSDINKYDSLKNIIYLNISPIYSNKEKWNEFKNKYDIKGTPTFIFFENGKKSDAYGWTEDTGFNYEKFRIWNNKINGMEI